MRETKLRYPLLAQRKTTDVSPEKEFPRIRRSLVGWRRMLNPAGSKLCQDRLPITTTFDGAAPFH